MEDVIKHAIYEALAKLGVTESLAFVVEHPADLAHGDYACNVALVAAKPLGQAPRAIAEQLATALAEQIEYVERIEVAGPGFLNFYLTRDFFIAELQRTLEEPDNWGKNDSWAGKKVLVEYTSPNLFKPLHVGNLVGNIIGESLTRLFEANGATVIRLNYPSDIGLTVAKGVWGLQQTGGDPSDIKVLGDAYRFGNEAYETDEAKKEEIIKVNQALYSGSDTALNDLRDQGLQTSKTRLLAICKSLGTQFNDNGTIYESDAAPKGIAVVNANIPSVFVESDGAVVYQGEKIGLHTRVFLNSKGLPTYEAKDLGNFEIKTEQFPDWDHSIVVTGNEQTEYFKVVYGAINELHPELAKDGKVLEHIPTGFLTLTTGKMSSRKGNILSGEQVLDELEVEAKQRAATSEYPIEQGTPLATKIATAAIKYQILKHGVGSNIVFDKEKALSFEGDSGPYLQYTYARIGSVLEKASGVGVEPRLAHAPTAAYPIEHQLYRFPEVTAEALRERAPHLVTTYLTQLASAFNTFYAHEKIADPDDEYAPFKAAVTAAVGATLKNGLWTLGIEAPERM